MRSEAEQGDGVVWAVIEAIERLTGARSRCGGGGLIRLEMLFTESEGYELRVNRPG